MARRRLYSSVLVVGLFWGAFGCGGSISPEGSVDESSGTSEAQLDSVVLDSPVPTTWAEYKLAPATYPEVLSDRNVELWARVWRPQTLTTRHPLAIFLHGNHRTCGHGSNPRIDDSIEYTTSGSCPAGKVPAPSHAGYDYIAQDLAAQGYIVVSINANLGINFGDPEGSDWSLNPARGRLILKHLEALSAWNRGAEPTPPTLGINLQNRLDLSRVSLMGHSRGGEGARAAYAQYLNPGSIWPGRIVTPVTFRRIFEIGPVDGQSSTTYNANNLPWAVLLPMCDGDVSALDGMMPFDRMMATESENPASLKATFTVWGANHNYYNTEWQVSDSPGCGGPGNTPLFSLAPGTSGSAAQQATGHDSLLNFFLGPLPGTFDPLNPVLASISAITRVDRGYTPSPDQRVTKRLEDFTNATGTSTYGFANDTSGLKSIAHQFIPEHDGSFRGAAIEWNSPGSATYFQTNFAATGTGIDLRPYAYLDLRVDRANDSLLNLDPATDFSVELVDDAGVVSAPQRISSYLSLTGPVSGPYGSHSMLQTARIPLSSFGLARLQAVRSVRLTFDRTASGSIYVGNVRATRAPCGTVPKLDLKVRQTVRNANDVQYRVQVFNRDSSAIKLSDLSVKLWISEPTTSLSASAYFAGNVYNGSGAYQYTASGANGSAAPVLPRCTHAPDRIADWSVTLTSTEGRNLPAGGAWADAIIEAHRTDWRNFQSFTDDFSQTPAYQGGAVSDRTWPNVYGDDTHFVLYYKGTPVVVEYVNASSPDPSSGTEPSCISKCFGQPGGVGGSSAMTTFAESGGSTAEGMSAAAAPASLASSSSSRPFLPASSTLPAQIVRLIPTGVPNAMPGGTDLEIWANDPFPGGDSMPVLLVGSAEIRRARFADPGDARRLTFTMSPEEFASFSGGERLTVRYSRSGGPEWMVGVLDKSLLGK